MHKQHRDLPLATQQAMHMVLTQPRPVWAKRLLSSTEGSVLVWAEDAPLGGRTEVRAVIVWAEHGGAAWAKVGADTTISVPGSWVTVWVCDNPLRCPDYAEIRKERKVSSGTVTGCTVRRTGRDFEADVDDALTAVQAQFSEETKKRVGRCGWDIHKARAAEVFDCKPSEVTDVMRKIGKMVNLIQAYRR